MELSPTNIISPFQFTVHLILLVFSDVLDLAWSSNDCWLASCSVDNCIVVWNAEKFPGDFFKYLLKITN